MHGKQVISERGGGGHNNILLVNKGYEKTSEQLEGLEYTKKQVIDYEYEANYYINVTVLIIVLNKLNVTNSFQSASLSGPSESSSQQNQENYKRHGNKFTNNIYRYKHFTLLHRCDCHD